MVVNTDSRRKSIAVAQEGQKAMPRKKRAHSLGPSKLSPLSRSRLSVGNIKGILKSRPSLATSSRGSNSPSSQQSRPQSQSFTDENTNATGSMDLTQDYQTPINDNFSRKSMGRRVSFKTNVNVRFFDKGNDTGSSAASQESPGDRMPSSDDDPIAAPPPILSDENAYPGVYSRRSSIRRSFAASEDMNMTSTSVGGFINGDNPTALLDEDMDFDDDNSEMDVTQSFGGNIRRRSSVGVSRTPLSQISSNPPQDQEESFTSYASEGESSEPMEITVPLNQSLRPAHQDEAWLALVKATHSGDASMVVFDDADGDGLHDTDVEAIVARDANRRYTVNFNDESNDSMAISEMSFDDPGNQTINLTKVMGRASLGDSGRPSVASSMDESEIYGNIDPATSTIAPQPQTRSSPADLSVEPPIAPSSEAVTHSPPTLGVFSAPPTNFQGSTVPPLVFKPPSTSPKKFPPFIPKSPTKPPPKQFSAAFAPPVARSTPKKPTEDSARASQSAAKKRERVISAPSPAGVGTERPSPAKRQALEVKWSSTVTPAAAGAISTASAEKGRATSPSKRTLLEGGSAKPTNSIRRPSGYYARRKSLGVESASASVTVQEDDVDVSAPTIRSSQKTTVTISRRASVSSGPANAGISFDQSSALLPKDFKGKGRASPAEVRDEDSADGKEKEAAVSPSQQPTTSPLWTSDVLPPEPMNVEVGSPAPKTPVVDLSEIFDSHGFGDEEETEDERGGPTGMDVAATEQWRDAIPADGYAVDQDPLISIEQFIEMTGIKFMDLTAPRRRSTHAAQLPSREPRDPVNIPLSEYVVAMSIDVPQLDLYSRVSRDLEGWMEQSKLSFQQAEEEAAKMTPELFTEYSQADQEGQTDMLHQLRLMRTNTRLQAKSDWYGWKMQWIDSLKYDAQKAFNSLQNDAKALEKLKEKTDEIVPELQQEYDKIMRELEAEQQEVAEIEQCDQEYLNELKNSIAEQNVEVESLRAEVKEANDQFKWLEERLEGVSQQKQEAITAIAEANRLLHIQTNSTRAEVWRLNNELKALEDIHMFHVSKVKSDIFEYVYASEYHVTIPCQDYCPVTKQIDITSLPEMRAKFKDDFPRLSSFLLSAAKEYIRGSELPSVRLVMQSLADFWSSTTQIRAQLRQLSIKYPVEIEPRQTPEKPFSEFAARTMVLFPAKKAKVYISFVFDTNTFARWPISVGSLRWEVELGYGPIDKNAVIKAISERMSGVTPSENYACLIDACIEAQEVCG